MKIINVIVIICLTVILFKLYMLGFTKQHEYVHQEIFRTYGINSTIYIEPIYSFSTVQGYTLPNSEQYKNNCNESCKNLNLFNEIISYNIDTVVSSIFICVFIVILFLYFNSQSFITTIGGD